MASIQTNVDVTPATAAPPGSLLVSLAPLSSDSLETALANLALAFPSQIVLVATPDTAPNLSPGGPLRLLPYTPTAVSTAPWVLTAADYLNAFKLAQENQASACLVLGAESHTLQPEAIYALAAAATTSATTTNTNTQSPAMRIPMPVTTTNT